MLVVSAFSTMSIMAQGGMLPLLLVVVTHQELSILDSIATLSSWLMLSRCKTWMLLGRKGCLRAKHFRHASASTCERFVNIRTWSRCFLFFIQICKRMVNDQPWGSNSEPTELLIDLDPICSCSVHLLAYLPCFALNWENVLRDRNISLLGLSIVHDLTQTLCNMVAADHLVIGLAK